MEIMRIRYVVLSLLLAVSWGVVKFVGYAETADMDSGMSTIRKIPASLGDWVGTDVPLEEQVFDILETRAIIHRGYRSEGKNVFLSLVYYPDAKVDFHAPEACLGGTGSRVVKSVEKVSFDRGGKKIDLSLVKLIRGEGASRQLVYYFYKSGDFIGDSYFKLRMSLLLNKVLRSSKSGALIRVSTNGGIDESVSSSMLVEFIRDLYPYLMIM